MAALSVECASAPTSSRKEGKVKGRIARNKEGRTFDNKWKAYLMNGVFSNPSPSSEQSIP